MPGRLLAQHLLTTSLGRQREPGPDGAARTRMPCGTWMAMNVGISTASPSRLSRMVHARDIVHEMVMRDVRIKYKRSFLGIAWAVLNPLLHLLVFYFIFQMVLNIDTPRFTAFALAGLLIWGWTAGALSQATSAITANSTLLQQPGFPTGMLPPVATTTHMIYFLLALPPLVAFLMLDGSRLGWSLLVLPLVLAVQFVFTLSVAYLFAAMNAYFRDTEHFTNVLLRLSMFISPIFYEASRVPAEYQWLYSLNPLVPLLEGYRAVLMYGTQPPWEDLAIVGAASTGALLLTFTLYRRTAVRMVDDL